MILIIFFGISFSACESFLETDLPTSRVVGETVYKNDKTAIAAISGIYHEMQYNNGFASGFYYSVTLLSGMSSDELINYYDDPNTWSEFYQNELTPQHGFNSNLWSSCYKTIYAANAVMEGVGNSNTLSPAVKIQLEGEAKFIRAFSYFYLVNLYGPVPLLTTTDYRTNRTAPRTPVSEVYQQIVDDLLAARELLSDEYISVEKVRPNKATATALLARTYLYMKDWINAETQATAIIEDPRYILETDLNNIFLANSNEAIWQMMQPVSFYEGITNEGSLFLIEYGPNYSQPAALAVSVVDSFEPGDLRRTDWVRSYDDGVTLYYYPAKYKNVFTGVVPTNPEHSMVFRLAEQYLIRAEARARQSNLAGSIADLDALRSRAQIPLIQDTNPGIEKSDLLLAIEQERKVELFSEWGHRWLDLKRTDRANAVLAVKPEWDQTDDLYPIPESEMLTDPNLKPQNSGY
jgi:hypothetical protein